MERSRAEDAAEDCIKGKVLKICGNEAHSVSKFRSQMLARVAQHIFGKVNRDNLSLWQQIKQFARQPSSAATGHPSRFRLPEVLFGREPSFPNSSEDRTTDDRRMNPTLGISGTQSLGD